MTINRGSRRRIMGRPVGRSLAALLAGGVLATMLAPGHAAAWSGDPDWRRRHGHEEFFGGGWHRHGWDDRFGGEGFGGGFLFAPPFQQPLYAPPPVVYVPQPPLFVPLPSDVTPAYQGGQYQGGPYQGGQYQGGQYQGGQYQGVQGGVPGATVPGIPARACYGGPYVCPLTAPAAVGAPCSCPVGSGRRVGGQAG